MIDLKMPFENGSSRDVDTIAKSFGKSLSALESELALIPSFSLEIIFCEKLYLITVEGPMAYSSA